jgi:hypothetical protein
MPMYRKCVLDGGFNPKLPVTGTASDSCCADVNGLCEAALRVAPQSVHSLEKSS